MVQEQKMFDISRVEYFSNYDDDIAVYAYKIDTSLHTVVDFISAFKLKGFLYFCFKDETSKDFNIVYKKCKLDSLYLYNIHYEG